MFNRHTSGHEFVGEVIALGSNFLSVGGEQATSNGRPVLYSTLKVGDKVVSPFTVSCGECRYGSRLRLPPPSTISNFAPPGLANMGSAPVACAPSCLAPRL